MHARRHGAVVGVGGPGHRRAEELERGVPEESAEGEVGPDPAPVAVDETHADGCRLEGGAETFLGFRQGRLGLLAIVDVAQVGQYAVHVGVVQQVGDAGVEPAPLSGGGAQADLHALGARLGRRHRLHHPLEVLGVHEGATVELGRLLDVIAEDFIEGGAHISEAVVSEHDNEVGGVLHERLEASLVGGQGRATVLAVHEGQAHQLGRHDEAQRGQHRQGVHEGGAYQRGRPVQRYGPLAGGHDGESGHRCGPRCDAAVGACAVDDAEEQAERKRRAPSDGVHDGPDDEHLGADAHTAVVCRHRPGTRRWRSRRPRTPRPSTPRWPTAEAARSGDGCAAPRRRHWRRAPPTGWGRACA